MIILLFQKLTILESPQGKVALRNFKLNIFIKDIKKSSLAKTHQGYQVFKTRNEGSKLDYGLKYQQLVVVTFDKLGSAF